MLFIERYNNMLTNEGGHTLMRSYIEGSERIAECLFEWGESRL